ncbi:Uncharacterized protein dnm_075430 [Desulfonema magnum]|uniref:Uncharacterized protein n=2 Tax=Desulfonema magnum TaxID=45655 RepID=A0A975BTM2_9BACT|nr:Uncharacterized protein dnm_075430 [Desulfonema magnum]
MVGRMNIPEYLSGISRLFLDTAPVIYYVEAHPLYLPRVEKIGGVLKLDFSEICVIIV